MSISLIPTVDLHGYIYLNTNLMCLPYFFSSNLMLNAFLVAKFFMFGPIGEVNTSN
jgi:hypothetical protein